MAVSTPAASARCRARQLDADAIRRELGRHHRRRRAKPYDVNPSSCHAAARRRPVARGARGAPIARAVLQAEGMASPRARSPAVAGAPGRSSAAAAAGVRSEFKPPVVSFRFGCQRLTSLRRAIRGLGARGSCRRPRPWTRRAGSRRAASDAIIAQAFEAGGHRGMFQTDDLSTPRLGTMALVRRRSVAGREPPGDRRRRHRGRERRAAPRWRSAPACRSARHQLLCP